MHVLLDDRFHVTFHAVAGISGHASKHVVAEGGVGAEGVRDSGLLAVKFKCVIPPDVLITA